jgi:DNA invertase Pin-like site-specific DNA recombinase
MLVVDLVVTSNELDSTSQQDLGEAKPLAILYIRVSTGRQVEEGHSLESQERTLRAAAHAKGYRTELVREEGRSGKSIKARPLLEAALTRLDKGKADALFALDTDRLSRSVADFGEIMERAHRKGWRLVVLSADVDSASPGGEMLLGVLSVAARFERRMISERVKRQHAERRASGIVWGVDAGPKPILSPEVREFIVEERSAGKTRQQIADELNEAGVKPARGQQWWTSSVAHVERSMARASA